MTIEYALLVPGVSALVFVVAFLLSGRLARKKLEVSDARYSRLAVREAETSRSLQSEKHERLRLEQVDQVLRSTVARIPWMIRDLMENQEEREIPGKALNLIEELFQPRYVAFFVASRERFVAIHVRGDSPFAARAEVGPHEGVVPWAAHKQLVMTPEDVTSDSGVMKGTFFGASAAGDHGDFSFCIPIVPLKSTTAVILVGPPLRSIPSAADFARAVGVMTAQSLRSIRALAQQTQLAMTDGLTGLANKKFVQDFLQRCLLPGESISTLGVFLFDLDNFKHYNDRNGHPAGDDLLRSLSEVMREVTREGEVLGRYGGEEFLLVMPNATKEAAMRGAERLRAAIASKAFRFGEGQPLGRISISGGVAAFPEDGRHAGELTAAADHALYEAKHQGRNRIVAYKGTEQVMQEDGKIEHDARDEKDEFITLEELAPDDD